MKSNKTYYLSDGSRGGFIFLGIVVVLAMFFFATQIYDNLEFKFDLGNILSFFGMLLCLNLTYKGIKKLYQSIRYNIPIVELYDSSMVVALHPGGKYSFAYKSLFGKYDYIKIEYSEIGSIYNNKKLFRSDYPRMQGFIFIKGIKEEKGFDFPTSIRAIDSMDVSILKTLLSQKGVEVSEMI